MINGLSVSHGPEARATHRDARVATAVQRSLPLRVALRLPMVDIAAVRAALGVNEDEVLDLIEDGHLDWAWDIASGAQMVDGRWQMADGRRQEVRILARSVSAYQNSEHGLRGVSSELTFEEVAALTFPQGRPWIWGRELARAFNCSSEHVLNLIREGSLKLLPGHVVPGSAINPQRPGAPKQCEGGSTINQTGWRRGPGGSPCVAYASALEFLKARRKGGTWPVGPSNGNV